MLTSRGYYSVKVQKFLHLGDKLADCDADLDDVVEAFRAKNVMLEDRRLIISRICTPLSSMFGNASRPVKVVGSDSCPSFGGFTEDDGEYLERMRAHYQELKFLLYRVNDLVKYVSAHPRNNMTFGPEIRALHILACTEVEALLRALTLLKRRSANIKSYYIAQKHSSLSDYCVKFRSFPDLPGYQPFSAWATDYDVLPWYRAYNLTKHDSRTHLSEGRLENVFLSLAACAVLVRAQKFERLSEVLAWDQQVENEFSFVSEPEWTLGQAYWKIGGKPLKKITMSG